MQYQEHTALSSALSLITWMLACCENLKVYSPLWRRLTARIETANRMTTIETLFDGKNLTSLRNVISANKAQLTDMKIFILSGFIWLKSADNLKSFFYKFEKQLITPFTS